MTDIRRLARRPKLVAAGSILSAGLVTVAAAAWACTPISGATTTASSTAFPNSPSNSKTLNMGSTGTDLASGNWYPSISPPDYSTVCEHSDYIGNLYNSGTDQVYNLSSSGDIPSHSVTLSWDPTWATNGGTGRICWSDGAAGQQSDHSTSRLAVTFS